MTMRRKKFIRGSLKGEVLPVTNFGGKKNWRSVLF